MTSHSRARAWISFFAIGFVTLLGPSPSRSIEPQPQEPARSAASEPQRLTSGATGAVSLVKGHGGVSLGFEANDGQVDAQVRYLARGPGYTLWLTQSEAVLGMHGSRPNPRLVNGVADTLARDQVPTSVLRIALLGANPDPQLTGLDKLPGIANYFLGNDHSRWRVGVPIYGKVKYEGIYSGIDLVYYWNQGQLEYDFIVAPGADPGQIRLEVTGNENIRQDEEGTLQLTTASGEIRLRRPQVYQVIDGTRHDIAARYVLPKEGSAGMSRSGIGIQLAAYDADLPLVIDPVITYSTYLG